jgi:hypothetical protein
MGQTLKYLDDRYWITKGSIWRPPDTILLRDEAKLPIGNAVMTSMLMTIYDLEAPTHAFVNGVDGTVSVLNARGCTLSPTGVFVLTLSPPGSPGDTAILVNQRTYERRRILIAYTWAGGLKPDALEITVVIRNVEYIP